MPAQEDRRVFISYAHRDGRDLALRLQRDLTATGFDAWLDEQRLSGGASWTVAIETALDRSDVVLALLTSGSYTSNICRAEQLRSLRKGKCVIPILAEKSTDIPLHLETSNYRDFTPSANYYDQLKTLLAEVDARNGAKLPDDYRVTYVTAPPLPANFVERREELASLRATLITDSGTRHIALTALQGMGGIGKTVLAQALCHDEVVQQAFPEGIIWVTAGRESTYDVVTRLREVGKALNDDLTRYDNELGCRNQYRSTIRRKAALIIIDDVWKVSDIEPLRAESSPRSRLLFTTRDASIAASVGAQEHISDLLTVGQSRQVLAKWSWMDYAALPPIADDLVRESGRLPLALSMTGAMLRNKPEKTWKMTLDLLRHADLQKIKAQFPDYPHPNLFRAIQVSVEALDPSARERYLTLAVLPEDMSIHPVIQQTLWNVTEDVSLESAEQFISLSLAQRDGEFIHLHDLQVDYVRAQFPDRQALYLIHGAVRLSSNVIGRDHTQFASQMVGRLLPHGDVPAIKQFTSTLIQGAPKPWLRPLHPALHPPGTSLVRTLAGHANFVNDVAVSADGRRAVSASDDRTLKVWDLETGRELHILEGHSGAVNGVAVSGDGLRAVSASEDRTVKIWDVETGRELRTLAGHSGSVYGVAMSADGRQVVSASSDQTLKVWDAETGRELRTLAGHSDAVLKVAVSGDGRRGVSASWDQTLRVWAVDTGGELRTLAGHSDAVLNVAVSADGRRAVSASSDRTLKVWDVETGRELRTLEGHSSSVLGVAMSGDGRLTVSASSDQTLKVWEVETGRELRTLEGHSSSVYGVALSKDGRQAVSASSDQTLKVWDLEMRWDLRKLASHSDTVHGVAVSGDGRRAISASSDQTLKVWDVETGLELRTLAGHSRAVNGVALSGDGRHAVSASDDQTLKVWDVQTGQLVRAMLGHSRPVYGVALSGDGRRAVSASWDRTLKVWEVETGLELRTLAGHSEPVLNVALSGDGRLVVSASWDRTLKVWDVETGLELRTLAGHSDSVDGVKLSGNGRLVVSASSDQTLKVWDVETGLELRTLAGHSNRVTDVALSEDGRRAASASDDNTLRVWEVDCGALVATFTCDTSARCCAFIGDDRLIAGDAGGHIHFLRLEELKPKD